MSTPRSLGEERGCPICDTIVGTGAQTAELHVKYRNVLITVAREAIYQTSDYGMEDTEMEADRIVSEYLAGAPNHFPGPEVIASEYLAERGVNDDA